MSAKPGKTQALNFYEVNEEFYLVDLPGYDFAKAAPMQSMDVLEPIAAQIRRQLDA